MNCCNCTQRCAAVHSPTFGKREKAKQQNVQKSVAAGITHSLRVRHLWSARRGPVMSMPPAPPCPARALCQIVFIYRLAGETMRQFALCSFYFFRFGVCCAGLFRSTLLMAAHGRGSIPRLGGATVHRKVPQCCPLSWPSGRRPHCSTLSNHLALLHSAEGAAWRGGAWSLGRVDVRPEAAAHPAAR